MQIDEVLTALQSPVRADLGRLLESYGHALTHEPSPAEDLTQLPQVQGLSGGQALNKVFEYGGEAGKYGAQVANAFLGTQKNDLAKLVAGTGRTASAFAANQVALQGLIDNFNVFTGALADQSENLSTTVHDLAPTLQITHSSLVSLDKSLPPLRTYAIELTPAVAELPGWSMPRSHGSRRSARCSPARRAAGPPSCSPKRRRAWRVPRRRVRKRRCRNSTSSASARRRC